MNLIFLIPSLANKGPIIVVRDLVEELVNQGCDVVVYYIDNIVELDFPCITHRFKLSSLLKFREASVVHSHCLRPDAISWFLKNILRIKCIFISTIHNYVDKDLGFSHGPYVSYFVSRIWLKIWSGLNACVVLTNDARKYYLHLNSKLNLHVVYNGRSNHKFNHISRRDEELLADIKRKYKIIGSIAYVGRVKGLDQIIRALPIMKDYTFVLIGDGPELPTLSGLAEELGVKSRFYSLGFKANCRDYLRYMDIYAMPSHSEGMPLSLLEAASAGIPIACSNIDAFSEIFNINEVGFFNLNDPISFKDAVEMLDKDRCFFSSVVLRKFIEKYSAVAMSREYIQVYRNYSV